MKRVLPCLSFILSLLCLPAIALWCVTCIADYQAIIADPSVSGIHFLGLGFLYGLGFVFCGVPGLIFSVLYRRFGQTRIPVFISYVLTVFYALCLVAALTLWLFGPGHP